MQWGEAWTDRPSSSRARMAPRFTRRRFRRRSIGDSPHLKLRASGSTTLRARTRRLLLSAGVHPKVVQERLGHFSSVANHVDIYSHVAPGMQGARPPEARRHRVRRVVGSIPSSTLSPHRIGFAQPSGGSEAFQWTRQHGGPSSIDMTVLPVRQKAALSIGMTTPAHGTTGARASHSPRSLWVHAMCCAGPDIRLALRRFLTGFPTTERLAVWAAHTALLRAASRTSAPDASSTETSSRSSSADIAPGVADARTR